MKKSDDKKKENKFDKANNTIDFIKKAGAGILVVASFIPVVRNFSGIIGKIKK